MCSPLKLPVSTYSSDFQEDSQSPAQFTQTIASSSINTSPSSFMSAQLTHSTAAASLPQQTFKSAYHKDPVRSTTNSMIHSRQTGTSFMSPHMQLTFNPAQSCLSMLSPQRCTFDSPTVSEASSSVFYSAVKTLLDGDTVGNEDDDDMDSNYTSSPQMSYMTPPSSLNRSISLPPQLQGRYGMSSSKYYSSSDYVSVLC